MRMRASVLFAIAVAVGLVSGHSVCAADNAGSGGVITYTDSSGSNPRSSPPYAGGYVVHTFTNSGSYSNSFTTGSADVLVVGGGGGGGGYCGGGGGAGGYLYTNLFLILGGSNYTVTVGSGGPGGTANNVRGTTGDNSIFGSITNLGGGGGGTFNGTRTGLAGGSGGGGSSTNATYPNTVGAGTSPQGYAGGNGGNESGNYSAGGGGGANGAGTNGNSAVGGGAGGPGKSCDISGATVWYAGGGGGGTYTGTRGTNGVGGGGLGGDASNSGTNGLPNTGGGGGGAGQTVGAGKSGNGGSGVVILRYPYVADGTAPTLVRIVDDQSAGPVIPNTLVTFTVYFSQDMDHTTVAAADFGNAGTAPISIGTVTETSPGVFTVQVTPTSGGSLRLQINQGADLKDASSSALDTASAIPGSTLHPETPGNSGYGGTITYTDSSGSNAVASPPYANGYVVHTFTNGSSSLWLPDAASADVLVVGGGGSGGGYVAGGGGAGGYVYSNAFLVVAASNYTVTVGSGGAAVTGNFTGNNGSNSVFGAITAYGGGGGGCFNVSPYTGVPGGSGGGGSRGAGGGASTNGQGYAGGTGVNAVNNYPSAGGGGAGGVGGSPATGNSNGGDGGTGVFCEVFAPVAGLPAGWFAGGGGGGTYAGTAGAGGKGGGGQGVQSGYASNGVVNTGGGGGGGGSDSKGGAGGSGVVIVRYLYSAAPPLSVTVTAPTSGQQFVPGSSITATVLVANGTAPYSVTFYTNQAVAWATNNASTNLFAMSLGTLEGGTYTNYATVTDSVFSVASSATNTFTVTPDTTAPSPDPMTFAVAPALLPGNNAIVMTATTAVDVSNPVEYYFENTNNSANSGWISSTVWTNTGLTYGATYGYRVKARDSAVPPHETQFSAILAASVDNRGSGGTITFTDSSGLNPRSSPPYTGGYVVHTFANSGTCNIPLDASADVLVVAGGGGGGQTAGGGGGAGGYIYSNAFPIAAGSNYVVTVGDGGAGAVGGSWPSYGSGTGGNGSNSVFGSLTAIGGGGGGNWGGAGITGGSGGGHGSGNSTATGATGTNSQGTAGGKSQNTSGNQTYGGGGGGGSQVAGGNATTLKAAGSGGDGLPNAISGSNVVYAGGGGGGAYSSVSGSSAGPGGTGGGGGGGRSTAGTNGVANTGGGGGGGGFSGADPGYSGGNGGSGIVIVKYLYNDGSLEVTLTSPTDGHLFVAGSSISPVATVLNGASPYTVTFYTNYAGGAYGPAGSTNASPYTVNLGTALAAGMYGIYASVSDNATGTATSRTNTFTVYVPPTSFFWTNTVNGGMSIAAYWTNDTGAFVAPVAAGQTNYALSFNQAGTYTVTHDLNNGFLLNQLNFGGATLTLQGNSLAFTNNAAALPQINQNSSNAITISTALTLGTNVTFGGTGTGLVTISTPMSGGGSLTKDGAGTLKLTAVNPYAGGTVVNNGTLELGASGSSGIICSNLTINSGATVIANSSWALGYYYSASDTIVTAITNNGGTLSFKDVAGNDGTAARTITLNGGMINLIGTPLDSNFDWYNGITTTPTLRTLASSTRSTVNCGIELRLGSDAGVLTFDVAAGSTSDGIDLLVSGAIIKGSGSGGSVTKTGSGTLLLTGTNTYTGATTISNGKLLVNGSSVTSVVTVVSGGTLGGTGTVGVVTNNGTLSPGNGAVMGTLTASNLVLNAGCTNAFDLGATNASDKVTVSGALTLNGGVLTVARNAGFGLGTYTLFGYGAPSGGTLPTLATAFSGYLMTVTNNTQSGMVQLVVVEDVRGTVYTLR